MAKYYITEDKIADFVARMWKEGIRVDADPKDDELAVRKNGVYHFIKVYRKGSFEALCDAFVSNTDDNQEAQS